MIDQNGTPEDIETYKAELVAAAEEVASMARARILARAHADGWSGSQAAWLDAIAQHILLQAIADGTPPEEALEAAFHEARRTLTSGYFNNALKEGKSRYTAFLTVVDLEKQLAVRRGERPTVYPDNILLEACRAVEAAAEQGASSEQQLATGFALIRKLGRKGIN